VILRVAPNSRLPAAPKISPQVAPLSVSSGFATGETSGCPQASLPLLCRRWIFEFPRIPTSRCCRIRVSGLPRLLHLRRVDDDSPVLLELCILWRSQRMNLRVESGLAHSCLTLDASSISIQFSATGKPTASNLFPLYLASSCQAGTAFQLPHRVISWIGA